jgi:multiple sugar transport system permease protein
MNNGIRTPVGLTALAAAFMLVWLFVAAFPFLWTLWGSFKVEGDFFSYAGWLDAVKGKSTLAQTGHAFTAMAYRGVWIEEEFWRAALHTLILTASVVCVSLSFGALGAYALARSGHRYAYWILVMALVFRAIPGIALVSGYLLPFFRLNIWGHLPTAALVLVALNQPFTLWLMHSFFLSIPRDLDESAMVDGCSRFEAFRLAIMPVMWPGIVTTGIFSFLVAYSDFVVCSMLLSDQNQTMVPRIVAFLGTTQETGKPMYAVAAVVSVTLPLIILVPVFQKRIVNGLAGAVKG